MFSFLCSSASCKSVEQRLGAPTQGRHRCRPWVAMVGIGMTSPWSLARRSCAESGSSRSGSGRCRRAGDRATGNRRLRGGRRRGAVSLGGSERVRAAAVVLVVPGAWPHGRELRARRPRRARPASSPPCSPSQHWMSTRSRVPCRCRSYPFRGCLQELTDSLGGRDD